MNSGISSNQRGLSFLRAAIAQAACLVAVSGFLMIWKPSIALSFLSGGLIHNGPNVYFALRLFRRGGISPVERARQAYAAAGLKFVLSALGFAVVFATVRPVFPLAVFAGYAVMWLGHTTWLAASLRRGS